jgi:hypothetical protein
MQTYNYLPGTIINTVDGGLSTVFSPTDDAVLVLGTAGTGVANTPFQVTDLNAASQTFGFTGSLFQACAEVASYSDNVIAYRIGSSPAVLKGVGADTTVGALTPGFNITFKSVEADASAIYQIWYAAGVLAVWNNGNIVFSNQSGLAVDTGDVSISSAAGLSGAAAILANVGLPLRAGDISIGPGPFVATHRKISHARAGWRPDICQFIAHPIDLRALICEVKIGNLKDHPCPTP